MKNDRFPLTCVLAVFLTLVLPFAVFALWDTSLVSSSHRQAAADGLSAEARANPAACTLYVCNHVLDIPIGYNGASESPWTQTSIDEAMLERTRSALRELHIAGLLTDAQLAQSLAACTATDTWQAAAAPGGLIQTSCTITAKLDEDSYSSLALNLVLTSADTPVYFNYQNSQEDFSAADAELLQSYCALLGLDSFADWQYPDWGGTVQNFGAAAYSESAQVYLTANHHSGLTLSAASMPPQDYAVLDTLYAKGDTP